MKLLKQFLNYPDLFAGPHSVLNHTMSQVNQKWVGSSGNTPVIRTKEKKSSAFSNGPLPAISLAWGIEREGYYDGRTETGFSSRDISLSELVETADKLTAKVTVSNWKMKCVGALNYNENNMKLILNIMARDLTTSAFSSVPWIKEILDDFILLTPTPWGDRGDMQPHQPEHTYVVPAEKLTEQQCKDISTQINAGWKKFTSNTKRPKDFKLKGPSFGVQDITTNPLVTSNPTIRTNPGSENKSKEEILLFQDKNASTPDHSFMLDVNNIQGFNLGVHICWRSNRLIEAYSRTPTGRHQTATYSTIWYPQIAGFSLIPVPNGATPIPVTGNWPGLVLPKEYAVDYLVRVVDQTQKRQAKGGYRGSYQGVRTLTHDDSTYWKVYQKNALEMIATGLPITGITLKKLVGDSKRELPMTIETYKKLPRPEVDVKAIEIGHLRLYRIAESPAKQVSAESLSDMLLPSMPSLLLAVDAQVRIASNDSYTSGGECYGHCDDDEKVDTTISPGLYTIDRKEKCSRGHDPGRKEYTLGFGDHCNEIITIRRMLAELDVFYDEFRANYVGSEFTGPAPPPQGAASASRLLGRI